MTTDDKYRKFEVGDLVEYVGRCTHIVQDHPLIVKSKTNAGFNGLLYTVHDPLANDTHHNVPAGHLIPKGTRCLQCEERPVDTAHNDVDMCRECRLIAVQFELDQILTPETTWDPVKAVLQIMARYGVPPQRVLGWMEGVE